MTAPLLDAKATVRACAVCGADLNGRRADARFCSSSCRREAHRLRRLLDGATVEGYRSFDQYVMSRQRRAKSARTPS